MIRIKEVMVAEGKDDTKQILKAVDVNTYKTNGSVISTVNLAELKKSQASRGLIVLTDPDSNGERVRKIISEAIPGVKHAFIKREDDVLTEAHGSLGIEHATPAIIKSALERLYTQTTTPQQASKREDLQKWGLTGQADSRKRREKLGQLLGIGYGNGEQLIHRLNTFQIDRATSEKTIKQINQEVDHE